MKVIFAHDHIFYQYEKKFYSNGSFPYDVLKRYIDIFGALTVLSRQKNVTSNKEVDGLTKASGIGVNFVEIDNFRSLKKLKKYNAAKKNIYKEVEISDLVIARLPSSIGRLAIKAAEKYNKPYLVEVVGCAWDAKYNHGSIFGKILAPYSYFQLKKLVANSSYIIYITKNFLQNRYSSNGIQTVCPNVKIYEVESSVLKNKLKSIEEISFRDVKLGLIGSLDVEYKGHETAIRALAELKNPNVTLELLGKGNSERWLKLAKQLNVSDQVKFKGSLPSGECVYKWIDSIDIMVQPSLAEAQGRAIIESMSRGCPILSSKVGGIVELLDDKYLIEPKDHKSLAKKIDNLISEQNEMALASKKNFVNAKEYYQSNIEKKREYIFNKFKQDNT